MLKSVYRRNSYVLGLRWPRPVVTRRAFLRKMFPDVSGSRWWSTMFRRRQSSLVTALDPKAVMSPHDQPVFADQTAHDHTAQPATTEQLASGRPG